MGHVELMESARDSHAAMASEVARWRVVPHAAIAAIEEEIAANKHASDQIEDKKCCTVIMHYHRIWGLESALIHLRRAIVEAQYQ